MFMVTTFLYCLYCFCRLSCFGFLGLLRWWYRLNPKFSTVNHFSFCPKMCHLMAFKNSRIDPIFFRTSASVSSESLSSWVSNSYTSTKKVNTEYDVISVTYDSKLFVIWYLVFSSSSFIISSGRWTWSWTEWLWCFDEWLMNGCEWDSIPLAGPIGGNSVSVFKKLVGRWG